MASTDSDSELLPADTTAPTSVSEKHHSTGSTSAASASALLELRAELAAALEAKQLTETRVGVLETELARFKDQHAFAIASKEAIQNQLREETARREAAEDKVEVLRSQVETSRRTVMQLQKQEQERAARRASNAPDDEDRLAAKRQSLYGRGRPPSTQLVGEASSSAARGSAGGEMAPPPPVPTSGLRELRLGGGGHARGASMSFRVASDGTLKSPRGAIKSPRSSRAGSRQPTLANDLFDPNAEDGGGRPLGSTTSSTVPSVSLSPVSGDSSSTTDATAAAHATTLAAAAAVAAATSAAEVSAYRDESQALRAQLERLAMQLSESEEARLASESMVKALREFISTDPGAHEVGSSGIRLPPLPTEDLDDEDDHAPPAALLAVPRASVSAEETNPSNSKWGFKLWSGSGAAAPPAPGTAPSISPLSEQPPGDIYTAPLSPRSVRSMASQQSKSPVGRRESLTPEMPSSETMGSPPPLSAPAPSSFGGFMSSWTKAAPAPPVEPPESSIDLDQDQPIGGAGAGLGRSLTGLFARRTRSASKSAPAPAPVMEAEEDMPELPPVAKPVAAVTPVFSPPRKIQDAYVQSSTDDAYGSTVDAYAGINGTYGGTADDAYGGTTDDAYGGLQLKEVTPAAQPQLVAPQVAARPSVAFDQVPQIKKEKAASPSPVPAASPAPVATPSPEPKRYHLRDEPEAMEVFTEPTRINTAEDDVPRRSADMTRRSADLPPRRSTDMPPRRSSSSLSATSLPSPYSPAPSNAAASPSFLAAVPVASPLRSPVSPTVTVSAPAPAFGEPTTPCLPAPQPRGSRSPASIPLPISPSPSHGGSSHGAVSPLAMPASPFSEPLSSGNDDELQEVLSSDAEADDAHEPGSPDTAANSDEPATPHESPRPAHAAVAAAVFKAAAAESEGEGGTGAGAKKKVPGPPARPPQRRSAARSRSRRGAAAVGEGAKVTRGGRI